MTITKEQWIAFLESVSLYELANIMNSLEKGQLTREQAVVKLTNMKIVF